MKCVICKNKLEDKHGNNPEPVKQFNEGRCCNKCNFTKVIPERIRQNWGRDLPNFERILTLQEERRTQKATA